MPTFPVAGPVPVELDLPFGDLHVIAGDRTDVVVTVEPADPTKSGSVRAAEDTRVERRGDTIEIVYPHSWKQYVLPFAAGGARVTIELPAGSRVSGKAGAMFAEGRLGVVDISLSAGDARIDEAARVSVKAAAGAVVVGRITESLSVRASAGSVRVAELTGDGSVRTSAGTTHVGSVDGSLAVTGSHGDITVGTLRGTVTAKAASSGIRVERIESGITHLTTSYGSIEVGVPEGTAAWLDVGAQHGTVRNQLDAAQGPVEGDRTAEVHASTGYGDVVVRRP
ncbi:Putative adhesin [Paraoerskovia marina]|uniref:Putative adhesin n=1 Tax=Paraoerskovia marina TaxID=545619 RepID=A0A1H1MZ52_9CELL|nr:DUF4097 family beta strand repeat-containing protein [Paraoerskovia marina]SDR92016.1 Putative adhesin [Paraoerskovia marina]